MLLIRTFSLFFFVNEMQMGNFGQKLPKYYLNFLRFELQSSIRTKIKIIVCHKLFVSFYSKQQQKIFFWFYSKNPSTLSFKLSKFTKLCIENFLVLPSTSDQLDVCSVMQLALNLARCTRWTLYVYTNFVLNQVGVTVHSNSSYSF